MNHYAAATAILIACAALMAQPSHAYGHKAGESPRQARETYAHMKDTGETRFASLKASEKEPADSSSYKEDARRTIRDLDRQIDALGKKVKKHGKEAGDEAGKAWKNLKEKHKAAKKQVKELSSAGKDAWEQTKSRTKDALEELRKAIDKAASYFK